MNTRRRIHRPQINWRPFSHPWENRSWWELHGVPDGIRNAYFKDIAPRLGFAWDLTGKRVDHVNTGRLWHFLRVVDSQYHRAGCVSRCAHLPAGPIRRPGVHAEYHAGESVPVSARRKRSCSVGFLAALPRRQDPAVATERATLLWDSRRLGGRLRWLLYGRACQRVQLEPAASRSGSGAATPSVPCLHDDHLDRWSRRREIRSSAKQLYPAGDEKG